MTMTSYIRDSNIQRKTIELEGVDAYCEGGLFQLGGFRRVTRVLITYETRFKISMTNYQKSQYIEYEQKLVEWLDEGVLVEIDVDGKVY